MSDEIYGLFPPAIDASAAAGSIGNALQAVSELLAPVRAAAVGLRHQLLADGFNETIAESVASQYLTHWMSVVLEQVTNRMGQ